MLKNQLKQKLKTQSDYNFKHINTIIFLQEEFDREKVDFQNAEDFVFGTQSMFDFNFLNNFFKAKSNNNFENSFNLSS